VTLWLYILLKAIKQQKDIMRTNGISEFSDETAHPSDQKKKNDQEMTKSNQITTNHIYPLSQIGLYDTPMVTAIFCCLTKLLG
jgi:hypothetical protein